MHTANVSEYCYITPIIQCKHTVKEFQVLQFNYDNSIQQHSFVQLNGSKYCYMPLTIQLNLSHLFIQLNDQTLLFSTIQFSISHTV